MKNLALFVCTVLMVGITNRADAVTASLVADTYVQRSTPTLNHGSENHLRVKNENGNNVRKAYMRFDTTGFNPVKEAMLNLDFFELASPLGTGGTTINWEFEVFGLQDGDGGEFWAENAITWDNAPANDESTNNTLEANAISLGTFDLLGRTGVINFSSAQLDAFLNADTNNVSSFIVVRNTLGAGGNTYIHTLGSADNSDGQAATLTAQLDIPEPTTASLALLGLAGISIKRRRRLV